MDCGQHALISTIVALSNISIFARTKEQVCILLVLLPVTGRRNVSTYQA